MRAVILQHPGAGKTTAVAHKRVVPDEEERRRAVSTLSGGALASNRRPETVRTRPGRDVAQSNSSRIDPSARTRGGATA